MHFWQQIRNKVHPLRHSTRPAEPCYCCLIHAGVTLVCGTRYRCGFMLLKLLGHCPSIATTWPYTPALTHLQAATEASVMGRNTYCNRLSKGGEPEKGISHATSSSWSQISTFLHWMKQSFSKEIKTRFFFSFFGYFICAHWEKQWAHVLKDLIIQRNWELESCDWFY